MTTALATLNETPAQVGEVGRGEATEINFGDLLALSKELVPTGFLPDHIKTPGQCAAIILTGREMGMGPMRALRSLQMVKGKVVENADSQLARFKADGGRAVWATLNETEAVLQLRHPNGDEHTETFTIQTAKAAGLLSNNVWTKYPKAMLRSRAITAGLKSVGWEGGVGNYDPAEAAEFAPNVVVPPVEAPTAPTRTVAHVNDNGEPVLPFGKSKGTPLIDMDEATLSSALQWAEEKGKYTEFQDAARAEIERRRQELAGSEALVGADAE